MITRIKRNISSLQKQSIVDKARILFEERGYEGTNIKAIAEDCGFQPANLYNYFVSKEEILYIVLLQESQRLYDLLKPIAEDETLNPSEKIRRIVKSLAEFSIGRRRKIRLLFMRHAKDLIPEHRKNVDKIRYAADGCIRSIIRRGIETGEFAQMDELFATYGVYVMMLRSRVWFSIDDKNTQDKFTEFVSDFLLTALKNYKKEKINYQESI
jgi:AcrR family transcriptional regulator